MVKKKNGSSQFVYVYVVLVLVVGFGFGVLTKALWSKDYTPAAVVIVANDSVNAPQSLLSYLESEVKSDCNDYLGTDTENGVPLASVYEVVQGKYARVALGCSTDLSPDFSVIKTQDGWKLFSAASYYVSIDDSSSHPRCSIVDEYRISKDFEPLCLEDSDAEDVTFADADIRENTYS